jgi:ABC-type polysaccharide/polyol phosphate transport system ATPase subunit
MEKMIKVDNVTKEYRLGAIGGATLRSDLQSWMARVRGKEDPNKKIGAAVYAKNERFLAVNGISFEVDRGEALGIIGHNGAGKSTLLKLISRVTAPTSGTIYLNGRIASMLEVGTGFHPELTGRENVYLNGAILGMSKNEINRKYDDIVAFSELEQFIDTPVKRYSSGMYVKLAFSVAAHLESEIMIMDEVLAVGDIDFQKKCLGRMEEAANKESRTVLYVSHNMSTIRSLCTKCMVLDRGALAYIGDVETAIQAYIGIKKGQKATFFDLRKCSRRIDTWTTSGVKLLSLNMPDRETNFFKTGEDIIQDIEIEADSKWAGIKVMLHVRYLDGDHIGSAISEKFNITAGKHKARIAFSTTHLPDGLYSCELYVLGTQPDGSEAKLDSAKEAFSFCIENRDASTASTWQHNSWGHTMFKPLELVSIS